MAQTLETAKVELAMGCFFLSNSLIGCEVNPDGGGEGGEGGEQGNTLEQPVYLAREGDEYENN